MVINLYSEVPLLCCLIKYNKNKIAIVKKMKLRISKLFSNIQGLASNQIKVIFLEIKCPVHTKYKVTKLLKPLLKIIVNIFNEHNRCSIYTVCAHLVYTYKFI